MNARTLLGAFLALLLPMPLVLLLASRVQEQLRPPAPADARVSPVLSPEERMERMTYHSECLKASDCEPPLGCLSDARIASRYCTDSECVTDAQCPERSVCRVLVTVQGGPWVRFCIPVGERQEGERCLEPAPDRGYACGSGLLCGGVGWCGRRCRTGEPTSCPEGFFCADRPPEPVCLPSCEARGCPEGQQCIRSERDGASVCAVVYGDNCQQTPCPSGSTCMDTLLSKRPGEAWMECIQRCGPEHSPCPEGRICARGRCQQPCEPGEPGTCGKGYRCEQRKPTALFLCEPDWDE